MVLGNAEEGLRAEEYGVGGVQIGTVKDDYGGLAICWDQSSGRSFSDVRATADDLVEI